MKKKKKFLKVLIPILAIIILLSVTVLAFGRTIFFAVAPEAYVSTLIKGLTEKYKEISELEKSIKAKENTINEKWRKVDLKELRVKHETVISNQIGRSATSVCANIAESKYGHSRADFIAKLEIALT